MKLQVQNCEKVPLNNFQANEQSLNIFGRVLGVCRTFCFTFCFNFVLEFRTLGAISFCNGANLRISANNI